MHATEPSLTLSEVYERTDAGQREMLTKTAALNDLDRRLLGVVTGYTSLEDILGLLGHVEEPQAAVRRLLGAGLISHVEHSAIDMKMLAHRRARQAQSDLWASA